MPSCYLIAILLLVCQLGCMKPSQPSRSEPSDVPSARNSSVVLNGKPAVLLSLPIPQEGATPRMVGAEILPGRGMNIYQLRAYVPGKGVVELLESPPLNQAVQTLNGGAADKDGNGSFTIGGAILVPYANRIRGKLGADRVTLQTQIQGERVVLPANWRGKERFAEPHAMHGLILERAMDQVDLQADANEARVTGVLNAGDFKNHWPSEARVTVSNTLRPESFAFTVTVENTGKKAMPVGIGWHPYFRLLSGNRQQARLHIPAKQRLEVNNYDDVFPTGKLLPLADTSYDFSAPGGRELDTQFLDDTFVNLQRGADGALVAEIIDPAARLGLRIRTTSPQVKAYQVYAPVDKAFVAFEPQYNFGDPFSAIWKGRDTGMVVLQPGQDTAYTVQVEPFVP